MVDGGYCANSPALFALTDATDALGVERGRIRLFSVGTGLYPERRRAVMGIVNTAVPTFATLLRTGEHGGDAARAAVYGRADGAESTRRRRTTV